MAELVLWLFVITLGVTFGAGCYEARMVVPLWSAAPPDTLRAPDSGRAFWAFVSTLALTVLTLASLALAWHARAAHEAWLVAAVIAFAERVATFGYFIPAMIRMQRIADPSRELTARFATWRRLNWARLLATLIAWLAALKALSVSG